MNSIFYGFFQLPIWGYFLYLAIMIQVSFAGITLYLHRDQTHRGLDLHPVVRHFFRLWLWMTTGAVTKEWVAVHRKHHARCETPDDPHSPQVEGLRKVLLQGAELYQAEADRPQTREQFGRGTPDDWLERNVYTGRRNLGIGLMFLINIALFGVIGITLWAVQMAAMPVFAAGIVNGIGHYWGYRNFECNDAARNISPWGFMIAGEELHNNHHAFPSSAKFSLRRWEFDIGWLYIKVLSAFGLARVRRVAPQPRIEDASTIDLQTVRAVIVNRMHVLRDYTRSVTLPTLKGELRVRARRNAVEAWHGARRVLVRRPELLDARHRERLQMILSESAMLRTVHEHRERLAKLWSGATVSNDKLLRQFKQWCAEAEATGIRSLEEFAQRLRGYQLAEAR